MITNGYCTLAEVKERWLNARRYVAAASLTFTSSTKTIADSAKGLKRFRTGGLLKVEGTVLNNGTFTINTGDTPASIVVVESLTDELAATGTFTLTDVSDPVDDGIFESMAEAISRAIDNELGRRFYVNGTDEDRYYTPGNAYILDIDDVVSVAQIATDEAQDRTYLTPWSGTDYDLWPYNAVLESRPYMEIQVRSTGNYRFWPGQARSVKVTGTFGFSATAPAPIREATLLAAEKLFRRKDAIFGVVGSPVFGTLKQIIKDDPELHMLLDGYRRLV
jgi:hypothetical protein